MGEAEAAVGAEAACIALYDPSDERLTIKFASGEKSEEVKGVTLALGQGIPSEAAVRRFAGPHGRRPYATQESATHPRDFPWSHSDGSGRLRRGT